MSFCVNDRVQAIADHIAGQYAVGQPIDPTQLQDMSAEDYVAALRFAHDTHRVGVADVLGMAELLTTRLSDHSKRFTAWALVCRCGLQKHEQLLRRCVVVDYQVWCSPARRDFPYARDVNVAVLQVHDDRYSQTRRSVYDYRVYRPYIDKLFGRAAIGGEVGPELVRSMQKLPATRSNSPIAESFFLPPDAHLRLSLDNKQVLSASMNLMLALRAYAEAASATAPRQKIDRGCTLSWSSQGVEKILRGRGLLSSTEKLTPEWAWRNFGADQEVDKWLFGRYYSIARTVHAADAQTKHLYVRVAAPTPLDMFVIFTGAELANFKTQCPDVEAAEVGDDLWAVHVSVFHALDAELAGSFMTTRHGLAINMTAPARVAYYKNERVLDLKQDASEIRFVGLSPTNERTERALDVSNATALEWRPVPQVIEFPQAYGSDSLVYSWPGVFAEFQSYNGTAAAAK